MNKSEEYLWCLHCERAFKQGEVEHEQTGEHTFRACPYEDCDGGEMDLWSWNYLRDCVASGEHGNVAHYPEIPERDKKYPLYPD